MNRVGAILFFMAFCTGQSLFAQRPPVQELKQQMEQYLRRAEQNGFSGSVLIADQGKVLLSAGYGLADRETGRRETDRTVFCIGSVTKQFTGAAILKLESEGKLRVSDTLGRFFPSLPAGKRSITLHQLLTHSAGFPGAIGDDYDPVDSETFIRLVGETELLFPPGSNYEYSNVGYSLLGIIVEHLSGLSYDRYLSDRFFRPLGMQQTGYLLPKFSPDSLAVGYRDGERWGTALDRNWLSDGPGWHLRANGGILSTVGDMFRWMQALQTDAVLTKAAREKLFSPHVREGQGAETFYGYGWVIDERPGGPFIWHNGGNGVFNAFAGFEPKTGRIVVVSSNANNKISDNIALRLLDYCAGQVTDIPQADRQNWTGAYRLPAGDTIQTFLNENDQLIVSFSSPEALRLLNGDAGEQAEASAQYGNRTQNMVEKIFQDDFAPLAEAWGEPLEAVRNRARPYWRGQEAENGPFSGIDILGSFHRPAQDLFLTYARLRFQQRALLILYVWRNGRLEEVRNLPALDKRFDYQGKASFFSPPNKCLVTFENDGKKLIIERNGNRAEARRL